MRQENFPGPVNIGSEEIVTINQLANSAIQISNKKLSIHNIQGEEFLTKYGFTCPLGVRGRNSDNALYKSKMNWEPQISLEEGMKKTFKWIKSQLSNKTI
jgi:GDP-D-mannose 3',5'-epimerase